MKYGVLILASVMSIFAMADTASSAAPNNPTTFLQVYLSGSKNDGNVREVASLLEARDYRCTGKIDVNAVTYNCSVAIKYRGATEREFGLNIWIPGIPFTQAEVSIQSKQQKAVKFAYERGTRLRQTFPPGTEVQFDVTFSGTDTIYNTIGDFGVGGYQHPVIYSNGYESTQVSLDSCRVTMSVSEQFRASAAYLRSELEEMEVFSFRDIDHATEYDVKMRGGCLPMMFLNPVHVPAPEGLMR